MSGGRLVVVVENMWILNAIHKADKPDVVVNFFDADRLAGKDRDEVNLFVPQTDAAAMGDDNGLVVAGIIEPA
jgi:hypothetical protein